MRTTSVAVAMLVAALLMVVAERIASGQGGLAQSAGDGYPVARAGVIVAANSNSRPDVSSAFPSRSPMAAPIPQTGKSDVAKPDIAKPDNIKSETPNASSSSPARDPLKNELRYEGKWVTTKNKKLDGTISCLVKPQGKDRWQGRFWGVWQQVPFDYTVQFTAMKDEPELLLAEGNPRAAATAATDGAAPATRPARPTVSLEIRAALKPAVTKPPADLPNVGKPIETLVQGIATIDGASYQWIGNMTPSDFTIQFTGSRYDGHIEMKRVLEKRKE